MKKFFYALSVSMSGRFDKAMFLLDKFLELKRPSGNPK